jgi:hypothetical protein
VKKVLWASLIAVVVLVVAFSLSGGRPGRFLCRNFRGTWLETDGYMTCYRGP